MLIKDWWYAINVCRKYGILWNPFRNRRNASFFVRWDRNGKILEKKIQINPFRKEFKTTFLHEVGHIFLYTSGIVNKIYHKEDRYRRLFERESLWHGGRLLSGLLKEESLAFRFARKAMKGKANIPYLVRSFQTYSALGYSEFLHSHSEDANTLTRHTDRVCRGIKRIEK